MRRDVELEINSANLIKSAAITPLHGRDSNANIDIARSAKCQSGSDYPFTRRGRHSDGALDRLGYIGGIVRSEKLQNGSRLLPARRPGPVVYPNQTSPLRWCSGGRIFFSFGILKEIFTARECLSRAYLRKGTATTKKSRKSGKILLTPV